MDGVISPSDVVRLEEWLTQHFDRTLGISDDSVEEAREVVDEVLRAGWVPRTCV